MLWENATQHRQMVGRKATDCDGPPQVVTS